MVFIMKLFCVFIIFCRYCIRRVYTTLTLLKLKIIADESFTIITDVAQSFCFTAKVVTKFTSCQSSIKAKAKAISACSESKIFRTKLINF